MSRFYIIILFLVFSLKILAQYPSCGQGHQINQDDINRIISQYRSYREQFYTGPQNQYFQSKAYKEDIEKLTKLAYKVFEHEKFLLEELSFTNHQSALPGVLCSDITSIDLLSGSSFKKYTRVAIVKDEAQTKIHGIESKEFSHLSPQFTEYVDMADKEFGSGLTYKVDSPWLLGCSLNIKNTKKTHHVYCIVPNFVFGFFHKIFHPFNAPREQRYKEVANCRSSGLTGEVNTHLQSKKTITYSSSEKGYYEADLNCLRKRTFSDQVLVTARANATGLVIDKLTNETIQQAKVHIDKEYFSKTDHDGRYILNDLPLDLENHQIHGSHRKYYPDHTTLKTLELGAMNGDYNIFLSPKTINLSGTVFNKKTHLPVTNYDVKISLRYKYRNGALFHKQFRATTDQNGQYKLNNVYCTYNDAELSPQTNAYETLAEKLDFDCEQTHTVRDFYLSPATTTIKGRVTDLKSKEGLGEIEVSLKNNASEVITTITDNDGNYQFSFDIVPFPYSGEFQISVSDTRSFPLYPNKSRDEKIISIEQTTRTFTDTSNYDSLNEVLTFENNVHKDFALKPLYNDIIGQVVHLQTQEALADGEVEIFYRGKLRTGKTDSQGNFLIRHVPKGNYNISSKVNLYQPTSKPVLMEDSDLIIKLENSRVDLIGRIVNAQTGGLITGFEELGQLELSPHINQNQIEISNGHYRINNISDSHYQINASLDKYYPAQERVTIDKTQYINKKDIILLPLAYAKDRIIIILTWGQNPVDLDSQIVSNNVLLNYKLISSEQNSLTGGIYARLDVDDVSSFGPETTVIQLRENGAPINPNPYQFLVYHYSGNGTIKTSEANVRVYDNGAKVSDIKINKDEESTSRLWHVLSVVNGNVIIRNKLKFKEEYAQITKIWDEIRKEESHITEMKEELKKIASVAAKYEANKIELRENLYQLFLITGDEEIYQEIYGDNAKTPIDFVSRIKIVSYNISMSEQYESSQIDKLEQNITTLEQRLSKTQNEEVKENLVFEIATLKKTIIAIQDGSNEQYKINAMNDLEKLKEEAAKLEKSLTEIINKMNLSVQSLEKTTGKNGDTDKKTQFLKEKIDKTLELIKLKQSQITKIETTIAKELSKYR